MHFSLVTSEYGNFSIYAVYIHDLNLGDAIKITMFAPSLLWKTVWRYYVNNSEYVKLMFRADITNFKQGPSRDLIEHIKSFRGKIDAYLGANAKMDEEEQARQLFTSSNQEWCEKGCFFPWCWSCYVWEDRNWVEKVLPNKEDDVLDSIPLQLSYRRDPRPDGKKIWTMENLQLKQTHLTRSSD